MTRPSLEEIADADPQVARFLERAKVKRQKKEAAKKAQHFVEGKQHPYEKNHIPETRDLGPEASDAINRCIMG